MYHEARVTKCPIFDRTCGSEELVHESEARHRPEGVLTVSELGGELASCRVEAHGGLRPESTRVAATEEYSINSTGGNPNVRLEEPTSRR